MRKFIFVMAMAVGTVAQAQDAPRPMMSPECRTEMHNLCPVTDDRDARRACMISKRDSISPKCKDEMAAMRKAREARGGGEGGPPRGEMGGMGGMSGGGMGGDHAGDQGGSPQ
jgi:hypothetical protein